MIGQDKGSLRNPECWPRVSPWSFLLAWAVLGKGECGSTTGMGPCQVWIATLPGAKLATLAVFTIG